jgi:hypothetical protein
MLSAAADLLSPASATAAVLPLPADRQTVTAEPWLAATVTTAVNSAPVAVDDPGLLCRSPSLFGGSFPIPEDFPDPFLFFGSCGLLANDTDADGDALSISVVTPPAHGWYEEVNAGGIDLAYRPDPDYSTLAGDQPGGDWVSDSLTYVATDGVADSNEATMRFWIAPINDPPSFTPGPLVIEVDEDSGAYSEQWVASGSISPGPPNESGQSVHFEVVELDLTGVPNLFAVDPAIDSSGVLTFTPGADQFGLAFVTVQAVDDGGLEDWGITYAGLPMPDDTSEPFQFAIVVNSVNDAPVALADSVTTDEDTPLEFDLVAIDDNGGTVGVLPSDPSHGTLQALGSAGVQCVGSTCTRTVIYAPEPDYAGLDSFTFYADDGDLPGEPATVTVTVVDTNDPPRAVSDTDLFVPQGSSGTVLDVLANDTSLPDGPEPLLIVAVTQGGHGTVLITEEGTNVTYVPDPMFHGIDEFMYTVRDPGGLSAEARVALTVGVDLTAPIVGSPHHAIRKSVQLGTSTLKTRLTWTGSDAGVGIDHFVVQRSTNGGSYKAVPISSPTATAVNQILSIGSTDRYRVRAIDRNGNASAWAYGPTFKVARYQETSRRISYGGTWVRAYGAKHSGGYVRYARVAGRSATFVRALRDVAFVAPTSIGRGTADIYVDGTKVASINLKSSSARYRRVLWAAHFDTLATHVIRVVITGSRRVDVDCFVALR